MSDKDENQNDDKIIPGHEYDGIQELDNPLPGWWLFTFFGTIIFGFLYYIHYTFTDAPDLRKELQIAMQKLEQQQKSPSEAGNAALEGEQELEMLFQDLSLKAAGKSIYISRCATCHQESGAGLVGPNLTDNHWIHGQGSRADILLVIRNGVTEKGMPGWKDMLRKNELYQVTSYVYSMKGTNVPGGKAPEGTEVK